MKRLDDALINEGKKEYRRCSFRLGDDGIKIIKKEDLNENEKIRDCIGHLGYMSQHEQGLDFKITDEKTIVKHDQVIFVYIKGGKPLGLLATNKKDIKSNNTEQSKKYISITDFAVVGYAQRNGIGKELFDYALNYYQLKPIQFCYNSPSEKTLRFLKKWYDVDSAEIIWCS